MTRSRFVKAVSFALLTLATQHICAAEKLLSCRPLMAGPPFVLKLDLDRKTVSGDGQYGYSSKEIRQVQVTENDVTWTVRSV